MRAYALSALVVLFGIDHGNLESTEGVVRDELIETWRPDAVIHYEIESRLAGSPIAERIERATDQFHERTLVRFRARVDESRYIHCRYRGVQ